MFVIGKLAFVDLSPISKLQLSEKSWGCLREALNAIDQGTFPSYSDSLLFTVIRDILKVHSMAHEHIHKLTFVCAYV